MKNTYKLINLLPVALVVAGGVFLLYLLLLQGRGANISLRVPVIENITSSSNDIPFAGELTTSDGKPSALLAPDDFLIRARRALEPDPVLLVLDVLSA